MHNKLVLLTVVLISFLTVSCAEESTSNNNSAAEIATNSNKARGEEAYSVCVACHLPDGEGVLGAFPPLKNRLVGISESVDGRAYLMTVILTGLNGTIEVDGTTYAGFMPGFGATLNDNQISAVLNYVATQLVGAKPDGFEPYTEAEVAGYRKQQAEQGSVPAYTLRSKLSL